MQGEYELLSENKMREVRHRTTELTANLNNETGNGNASPTLAYSSTQHGTGDIFFFWPRNTETKIM